MKKRKEIPPETVAHKKKKKWQENSFRFEDFEINHRRHHEAFLWTILLFIFYVYNKEEEMKKSHFNVVRAFLPLELSFLVGMVDCGLLFGCLFGWLAVNQNQEISNLLI